MNRRSVIVMLIGVVSALTGFATAAFVAQNRCQDAGGHWDAAIRKCELASGEIAGLGARPVLIGIVVAVFLAVMLYRGVLFLSMRAARSSTP